jgi:hypothetical protein
MKSNLKNEEYFNSFIVPRNEQEIRMRFLHLRKIAKSYWDIFAFCFGYCIIYPLVNKISLILKHQQKYVKYNVIASLFFSYVIYRNTLKFFSKYFNSKEYEIFKTFCLKYDLNDELLI